jgi:hypothetical protein
MSVLRSLAAELFGLFVDDRSLALVLIVWVTLVFAMSRWGVNPIWLGPVLFGGIILILVENVFRPRG